MSNHTVRTALTVAIPFVLQPAFAAGQPATPMADVLVTATRFASAQQPLAIAAQVITAEDIRDSSATTLVEVLSKVGGVHSRSSLTGAADAPIDLRGFGATGDQNTLILVNGQRISENELIAARISAIPMDAIERIEILRGSGAVLYGSGATGGTINIITRSPVAAALSGNVFAQLGSHGARDLRVGMQTGGELWGLRLNAQHGKTDHYRDNNQSEQNAMNGELRLGTRQDFVAFEFNSDNQKARTPGPRTEAQLASDRRGTSTPDDYLNSRKQMYVLRAEKNLGAVVLAMDAGYRDKQADMYSDTAWGDSLMKTDTRVTTISPRLLWTAKLAKIANQLTFGVDWSKWSYHNDTAATGWLTSLNEFGKQRNHAVYVHDEMSFASGTRLSLGARRENVRQNQHELLIPKAEESVQQHLTAHEIALQQALGGGYSIHARSGRSFRIANIDENRCWFAPCPTPLLPQTSHDHELGMAWQGKTASLRASLFQMNVSNELHYNNLTFSNMNLSPTRHRGLELEGSLALSETLDLAAHYRRTQARFRTGIYGGVDVSGNDVPLVPRHRLGFNLGWQAASDTRASFNVQYVGSQRYDNDQANLFRQMPSYTVADVKVSHQLGAWRLAAGINNLFDEKYYSYGIVDGAYTSFNAYPEDGRNIYVSAEYRF